MIFDVLNEYKELQMVIIATFLNHLLLSTTFFPIQKLVFNAKKKLPVKTLVPKRVNVALRPLKKKQNNTTPRSFNPQKPENFPSHRHPRELF